jgi:outer membrane usher protein FimD/PapC
VVRFDYPTSGPAGQSTVGRTNAEGYAMPPLRAHDVNPHRSRSTRRWTQVDKLKMEAVPYYRSGLLLDFRYAGRTATLRIRLDDGAPIPRAHQPGDRAVRRDSVGLAARRT